MEKLLKELKEAEIEQDYDLDFYNGVIYALWKLGKINAGEKIMMEDNLQLRLLQVKEQD